MGFFSRLGEKIKSVANKIGDKVAGVGGAVSRFGDKISQGTANVVNRIV